MTKPVVPLSTAEVYEHINDVPYDNKNRSPWREHQAWLRQCHEAGVREQYATPLSVEQASILYDYAWQKGHSTGYYEVDGHYADLVEMVEKILAL